MCGGWHAGRDPGVAMRDATTGDTVALASSSGIDFAAVAGHARTVGSPALRAMTFHERAAMLKALAKHLSELKEEFYALSYRTGATKSDSQIDIDGGIGTMFAFAGKGSRELPNAHVYVDGDVEGLSKGGSFVGQHIYVSREGAAVHINAFNFPVWGMLEKLAPTLLAGMPAIVKPATATAYLTQLAVRRIIESTILPEGALQLVCGSLGNLFEHLELPGHGLVHRFSAYRGAIARASDHCPARRALHRGDRFPELQHPCRGWRTGQRGVRSFRQGSRT